MKFVEDLINIIFPKLCCVCDQALTKNEDLLCFSCRTKLPKTGNYDKSNGELASRFIGKIKIDCSVSYIYFYKSGISQKILHQLKYNNYPQLGEIMGKWFGHELKKPGLFNSFDIIIPVPLHPQKQRKRGYNQSYFIAKGISEALNIPLDIHSLIRTQYQKSQTQKTKEQRWKTVENAFEVIEKRNIENKNILLVDDVVTTGATLEACGDQLIDSRVSKIGVATLALAK